jgi:glycosyltransferase involved in cell wall biosynthesis
VSLQYFVKEPTVDVVIVNRNYARFVANAIQSVKDQSYQNFRCIVVDNGSDDNSKQCIAEAIDKHTQFTFHTLPSNLGHLGAALWSLAYLNGEFITFLDADDVLFPNYLASHLQAHLAAGSSVGFTSSNCVDMNGNGVLLTSGNWNMYDFWRRGTPALRPMERTVRLPGVDDRAYAALSEAVRYLPAHTAHWCWCPGSSNMFRRALLDRIRPTDPSSPALLGGVDGFYLPILHALTGTILIDQPLSAYRLHGANDYSILPSIHGLVTERPSVKSQSFNTYLRMLTWLVDHFEEIVQIAGEDKYWKIFATVSASNGPKSYARNAFANDTFRAALSRQYCGLVKLFGEQRMFRELRQRLSFLDYLKVVRDSRGRFPVSELSRACLRETARRGRLVYYKVNRSKENKVNRSKEARR